MFFSSKISKRFKASELTSLLIDKLKDIDAPELLYDDSIWVGNVMELSNHLNN